jgi:hypothetical protein
VDAPQNATRVGTLCLVAVGLLLLLPAGGALAQGKVAFHLMVSHVSQTPGPIDPRGDGLHAVLKREIRYESLKVLDTQVMALQLNDIGTMKLPTGRRVRVRPMDLGEDGVLVAVEIEGSTQADLRVPNRRIVVIGGQPYQDGRLVISLEPRY